MEIKQKNNIIILSYPRRYKYFYYNHPTSWLMKILRRFAVVIVCAIFYQCCFISLLLLPTTIITTTTSRRMVQVVVVSSFRIIPPIVIIKDSSVRTLSLPITTSSSLCERKNRMPTTVRTCSLPTTSVSLLLSSCGRKNRIPRRNTMMNIIRSAASNEQQYSIMSSSSSSSSSSLLPKLNLYNNNQQQQQQQQQKQQRDYYHHNTERRLSYHNRIFFVLRSTGSDIIDTIDNNNDNDETIVNDIDDDDDNSENSNNNDNSNNSNNHYSNEINNNVINSNDDSIDDNNKNNDDNNNNNNIIYDGNYIIPDGITLKLAVDKQGGVYEMNRTASTADRFTCSQSLDLVHRLRCVSDAIIIGKSTVIADNPSLTIRRINCTRCCQGEEEGQVQSSLSSSSSLSSYQPLRVILDSKLSLVQWDDPSKLLQQNYTIITDGLPTVIYYSSTNVTTIPTTTIGQLQSLFPNLHLIGLQQSSDTTTSVPIPDIINHLRTNFYVRHIMVEGGPTTVKKFIEANCIDRCIVVKATSVTFQQPLLSGITPSYLRTVGKFQYLGLRFCGSDTIHYWSKPNMTWPVTQQQQLQNWP